MLKDILNWFINIVNTIASLIFYLQLHDCIFNTMVTYLIWSPQLHGCIFNMEFSS